MPGNVALAQPVGVLPRSLSTAFSESRIYPILQSQYHDDSIQRSIIQDGINLPVALRMWKLSKRLSAPAILALRTFWEQHDGGMVPFYFYDPFGSVPGMPIGSNFDETGSLIEGRVTVVFRGNWAESTDLARSVLSLQIAEIA